MQKNREKDSRALSVNDFKREIAIEAAALMPPLPLFCLSTGQ